MLKQYPRVTLSHNVTTSQAWRLCSEGGHTHGCVAVFWVVMKDKHCSRVTERRPWTWPSARSRGRRSPMMQWQLLEIAAESALARCKGLFIAGFWRKKTTFTIFQRHQSGHLVKFKEPAPFFPALPILLSAGPLHFLSSFRPAGSPAEWDSRKNVSNLVTKRQIYTCASYEEGCSPEKPNDCLRAAQQCLSRW